MHIITQISSQDTFPVRNLVLRTGKPIETCHFTGDDLSSTKHFGLYINQKITGVISIYKNKNSIFKSPNQSQIRGMSVLSEFQGKGIGKLLVNYSENYLVQNDISLLWFNARETAVPFYEKLGYTKTGLLLFEIADVGTHFLMFKNI